MIPKILLVVRSYNKPEMLETTLNSLIESDINLCSERCIYDDMSNDSETLKVLFNSKYNTFDKIQAKENHEGNKQSFISMLELFKNTNNDFLCVLENDVVVKKDFIYTLAEAYIQARHKSGHYKFILSGFNPTNAHLNGYAQYRNFYFKKSCSVNYFFHKSLIPLLIKGLENDDLFKTISKNKHMVLCLNNGVVQHLGKETDEGFYEEKPPISTTTHLREKFKTAPVYDIIGTYTTNILALKKNIGKISHVNSVVIQKDLDYRNIFEDNEKTKLLLITQDSIMNEIAIELKENLQIINKNKYILVKKDVYDKFLKIWNGENFIDEYTSYELFF